MSLDTPTDDDGTVAGKRLSRAPELARGTCVGRYLLLEQLGQGGMGVVYRAFDPELDRPVALKLLQAQEGESGGQRDRLLREAQALARLSHPNVVAVHDVGVVEGTGDVFIAMEFVQGQTLRGWLGQARRSRREILEAFLAAGEGLAAAHRAGLVHRDFKPDNVIVGDDGRVRVLDFGLARTADASMDANAAPKGRAGTGPSSPKASDGRVDGAPGGLERVPEQAPRSEAQLGSSQGSKSDPLVNVNVADSGRISARLLETPLTRAGAIVGTPRFMAPEQHTGDTVDERADQFSFCVTLYWALYQTFPFMGTSPEDTFDRVLAGRISDPPPGATVPRWLRQVLLKGLARRPADRYPTMSELLAALRADPWAARRRWLGAVTAVLMVGGLAFGWRAGVSKRVRACAGGVERLGGVWDEARRSAVRAAFRRSGMPYADAILRTVEHALDGYARGWVTMHTDACEATHVRHEQSQELLDLRMTCLADRLLQLKTLTDLYADADAKLVERAALSAESLPPLEHCADMAALRAPVPPPSDPQTRARVDQVRKQLSEAHALGLAGRHEDGIRIASAAVAAAESLKYRPVEAEARLTLGEEQGEHGDVADSTGSLYRALSAALAGRHDEIVATAAIDLILATGGRQSHYEEADRWVELASAAVERLQRKDDLLASFYQFRSDLRSYEDKLDEALADARRALELIEKRFGADDRRVARALGALGQVYYARAEFPDALKCYQRKLAIEEKALGPDHPDVAGSWLGLGNVIGDTGDHEAALKDYARALEIYQRVNPGHLSIPVVYNNMGQDLESVGRKQEALEKYKLAYSVGMKTRGPSQITILAQYNLANLEVEAHHTEEALRDLNESLASAEKVFGREHHLCAKALWSIGDIHRSEGRYDQALAYYQRALPIAEKTMTPTEPNLAGLLVSLGSVQIDRHEPKSAIAPLERALKIYEAQTGEPVGKARSQFALARALWDLGTDRDRALKLANQAHTASLPSGSASGRELQGRVTAWLKTHR
jgi:serine/threonine protein kinase/tetratricopeptide (TPR) repeat protein